MRGRRTAAVVLARVLRNLVQSDPELHQDRRLWQEVPSRTPGQPTQYDAVTLDTPLTSI